MTTARDIIRNVFREHQIVIDKSDDKGYRDQWYACSADCDWAREWGDLNAHDDHRDHVIAVAIAALRAAGLLPTDDAEARGDYARGRRDAAKAIRLAAEKEFVAGNIPSWLRPGSPIYPSAEEARRWVIDWVADIAEHGAITEETP